MRTKLTAFLILATAMLLAACSPTAATPPAAPNSVAPETDAEAAAGAPQLVAEATLLDLGAVVNGVVVERDVIVQNTGDAPLIVDEVVTTCGCTTAALTPMTLAPGESGNLHIAFDSGAHGPDLTGPIMRRVILVSNDPAQPEANVDLQANILPRQ